MTDHVHNWKSAMQQAWKPMLLRRVLAIAALVSAFHWSARAALPEIKSDEVIILYNKKLPQSKGVADYYAEKRGIPQKQIFGFNVTTNEEMSRAEFRENLQKPLAKTLESEKLWHIA